MREQSHDRSYLLYLILLMTYVAAIVFFVTIPNFVEVIFKGHGQSCAVKFEPAYIPPDVEDKSWYVSLGWRIGNTATNKTWTMYYYVWNPDNTTCTIYFTPLYQQVYKVPDEVEVYTNLTNAFTVSAEKKLVYVNITPHREGTFIIAWNVSGAWNWYGPHGFVVYSYDPIPPEVNIVPSYVSLETNQSTNLTISIKNPGTVLDRKYVITINCGELICDLSKNTTTIPPQGYDYINLTVFANKEGRHNIIVYARDSINMIANASAIVEVIKMGENATQNATRNVTENVIVNIYPSTSIQIDKSKTNTTTLHIYITNNMNQTETFKINIQCPQDLLCAYDKDTITLKSKEYGYVKLDIDVSRAERDQYSILVKISNNVSIERVVYLYIISSKEKGVVETIMKYLTEYWYIVVSVVVLLLVLLLIAR